MTQKPPDPGGDATKDSRETGDDSNTKRISGDDPHDKSGRNLAKPEKLEGDRKTQADKPKSETGA